MRVLRASLGFFAALLWTTTAFADPIRITLWDATTYLDGHGRFHFVGPLTNISGDSWGQFSPTRFNSGDAVVLGSNFSPDPSQRHSDVYVNGTVYTDVVLPGDVSFVTNRPFRVPAVPDGITAGFASDFIMTGRLDGYSDACASGNPLFSADLTGNGVLWAGLYRATTDASGVSHWVAEPGSSSIAAFRGPAPTPEPTSLLCLEQGSSRQD